jgi:hypothetical protein
MFAQPREGPCSKAAAWTTSAFSGGVPATFLRKRIPETLYHTPCKVLVVQITVFLPSMEELALFCEGVGTLKEL